MLKKILAPKPGAAPVAAVPIAAAPVAVVPTALCQIMQVLQGGVLRWKWRYTDAEGRISESLETWDRHYQCAAAVRLIGYKPEHRWLPAE